MSMNAAFGGDDDHIERHFSICPRTPPRHFAALSALVGSMSLDFQVVSLPYKSSSFAT
jgi:hypothetical protein